MARTMLTGLTLILVATVACGDGGSATTVERLPAADVVVREWMDAIAASDTAVLDRVVASPSLAFVVGLESRLTPRQIVELVDEGLPTDLVRGYWASFADSFEAIDGGPIDELSVGSTREFAAAGARYTAVAVGENERTADILVRRSVEGRWEVDVLATVGPGMAVPLVELAGEATDDRFRTLFEQWVFPALEAASFADVAGDPGAALRDVRLAFDTAA